MENPGKNTAYIFSYRRVAGAAIAQSFLRHKSKKVKFRSVFWLTVIINCGILALFLTPDGAHQLDVIFKCINLGN